MGTEKENIPTAWFEFLLNPSLLEDHLSKTSCDPSPVELIVHFIFNSMKKNENSTHVIEAENQDSTTLRVTEKMKHVLTVLPLQVAAHLEWKLPLFQEKLPLHIQDALLNAALQESMEDHASPTSHSTLDTGPLLPHQLFGVGLYHRYALSTIVRWKLPSKPVKISSIPIPGQQDPMYESREIQEGIIASLERGAEVSLRILEQLLSAGEVRAPSLSTFSMTPTDRSGAEVKRSHRWDKCKLVPDEQFKFQIHYELGNYLFLLERFGEALHHFSEALQLLPELGSSPSHCCFEEGKLRGFHASCLAICGRSTPVAKRTLYDRFLHSVSNDFEGLIEILTEDNICEEIPFYLRLNLQLDLTAKQDAVPETLLFHIRTLNAVGDVLQGRCWDSSFTVYLMEAGREGAQYLVQLLGSKLTQYTSSQRKQIRFFVETLSLCPNQREILVPQIMTCAPLASLFSHEEIVSLWPGSESKGFLKTSSSQGSLDFTVGSTCESINDFIWNILHSNDPSVIEKSFMGYRKAAPLKGGGGTAPKKNVLDLNSEWENLIPMPVRNTLVKLTSDPLRNLVFLYVAKSQELTQVKSFPLALDLLNEAVTVVRRTLPKDHQRPCRMIKWMALVVKVQRQIFDLPCVDESTMRSLSMEAKQCLSLLSNSREPVLPWTYIIHWCVLFLLNTQDWLFLTSNLHLPSTQFSIAQLVKPLASCAHALQNKTSNKKAFSELFNTVADIVVGNASYNKEQPPVMRPAAFLSFVECVREPLCLSLLISLLGHLYNVKMHDPSIAVHIDHKTTWPASYGDVDFLDKFVLRDVLNSVLDHATSLYSSGSYTNASVCSSWFLTKADLAYQRAHRKAIQNYLMAIFVATNYLRNDTNNPDQNAMSDLVVKRMINSCRSLECYTQAAVLCQFLETIDYNSAVGCLQERSAIDGMDAYYDCLFDVTLMEFIINIHQKKGEFQKRDKVLKIIGLLEINSNNNEEIQREAAKVRKHRFLRAMGKQYL